jgi:transcriptional regulator with XRE-family HTH domain
MKTTRNFREQILENPVYWVEGINGMLYDAIVTYMDKHQMKQKDLAKHLSISPGRVSQILNDGNINFSLEKIIEIAMKVDKIPNFLFEDKSTYLQSQRLLTASKQIAMPYNQIKFSNHLLADNSDGSVCD